MGKEIYLIAFLIITGLAVVIYIINRKLSQFVEKSRPSEDILAYLKTTNTRLDEQNKNINQVLASSTTALNSRLDNAAKMMGQLQRDAGKFAELSLSMKNLQDYLKSPKLRGNIGEQVLKDLISQMFPKNSFFLQYTFKSGNKVDAAIKTDAGILPIDSKFPSENFQKMMAAENEAAKSTARRDFNRDVKKHISDIAQKYILPEEGTMDFALMYVPSEPVYYEVVNDTQLTDYARKQRVYPVSPNTLYANLQVILLSFQGREIESKSRQIFTLLRAIQKDYGKLGDTLSVLNKHVTNSYNQMANVNAGFTQIGQKLSSTDLLAVKEKTKQLEIEE